jgi:hypothetical protein
MPGRHMDLEEYFGHPVGHGDGLTDVGWRGMGIEQHRPAVVVVVVEEEEEEEEERRRVEA